MKTSRKIERLDITKQVEKAARAVGEAAGALIVSAVLFFVMFSPGRFYRWLAWADPGAAHAAAGDSRWITRP